MNNQYGNANSVGSNTPAAPSGAPQQPVAPQYASTPQQTTAPQYASAPQQPTSPQYASAPQQPAATKRPAASLYSSAAHMYTPPTDNVPPVYPYAYEKKLRAPVKTSDIVCAVIFFVLSVVSIDFGLFGGFNLGYAISVAAVAVFTCVYGSLNGRFTVAGGYFALCAVAISAAFAFYNSPESRLIQIVAVWVLLTLSLLDITKSGAYAKGEWRSAIDIIRLMIITPFERMGSFVGSFRDSLDKNSPAHKRFAAAAIGVACAVPALIVILPLLISSDAAFEELIRHTIFSDIPRLFGAVILGFGFFMLFFTALFASSKKIAAEKHETAPKSSAGLNSAAVSSFLAVISFVYIVYLLSQITYFFGAFSRLLPENFTVAEYARRGFFEMTAICAINLLLVALALILTKRNAQGRVPRSTKGLCIFIIAFSLAVIVTVCGKLALYMSNFGLTKLRVYTTVFCVMLAVVFICALIRLCARRFPYFRVCAVVIAAIGAAVSLADVNTTIAYYNYEAYQSGVLSELDVEYFGELGDAGVPYLIELLDSDEFKYDAVDALTTVAYDYGDFDMEYGGSYDEDDYWQGDYYISSGIKMYDEGDFRSYNMEHKIASDLIEENWNDIRRLSVMSKKLR